MSKTTKPIIEVRSVSKSFPGVQALKAVDFELYPGEVHCLVGANGAGKSTLVKILSGIYKKDEGKIYYKGQEIEISSPREAKNLGIVTVFQELDIVPHLTIAENVFLGNYPRNTILKTINYKELYARAAALLRSLGEDVNPFLLAGEVSAAIQQMVVIARALVFKAEAIILDEPTAVLTVEEQKKLFNIVHDLRSKGVGVIYISHRLEEILEIGDRVTVFRDGKKISTRKIKEVDLNQIIKDMTGEDQKESLDTKHFVTISKPSEEERNKSKVLLEIENLCSEFTKPKLENVSLKILKGEIIGIFGFVGSGRTELAKCLSGHIPLSSGEIRLEDTPIKLNSPWEATEIGIAMAPEERKTQGLFLNHSVLFNFALPLLRKKQRKFGVINWKEMEKPCRAFVEELEIKTPSLYQIIRYLSGGNQQKVILARWLAYNCKLLILDEPTRGIDVMGKKEIMNLVKSKAREGISFIIISSEAEELMEMCDRIAVLFRGKLMGVTNPKEHKVTDLLKLASGVR
ncbi:sugar ABC transporter ATP-binding protein [Thermatribacter velox]|uniref:Sugar ABC transporter ATP-binding protein n=1 Tax=Thermatribacter velox TaxID=3039681 RepID=A0ABZ2YE74_9BACT